MNLKQYLPEIDENQSKWNWNEIKLNLKPIISKKLKKHDFIRFSLKKHEKMRENLVVKVPPLENILSHFESFWVIISIFSRLILFNPTFWDKIIFNPIYSPKSWQKIRENWEKLLLPQNRDKNFSRVRVLSSKSAIFDNKFMKNQWKSMKSFSKIQRKSAIFSYFLTNLSSKSVKISYF